MPYNLNLITQAAWRVTILHWVARALGVLVHVEGMPFGSTRNFKREHGMTSSSARNEKLWTEGHWSVVDGSVDVPK